MSRIGKQRIEIPSNVEIKLSESSITTKGPKGNLELKIPHKIHLTQKESFIVVSVDDENEKNNKSLWGTTHRLIENMLQGVTTGFQKKLVLSGVGFRASVTEKKLLLELGLSHPLEIPFPENIAITTEGNNIIIISGIDKHAVGQAAARIRALKKPEPYKGKGISYEGEVIRRKAGKQAATSAK